MTPSDNKIAVMYRLLEDLTSLRHRLDDIKDQASKNWKVMETLSAENRLYRNILESLAQRYFLKDERLCFILCSKKYASDLGKAVDEIIGNVEEDLVPAELANIRRQQEMRIIQLGQSEEVKEILVFDGQQRTFLTIRVPLMSGNGSVSGIFGVTVDIGIRGGES
jgi:PAS domain S-box-containing protein